MKRTYRQLNPLRAKKNSNWLFPTFCILAAAAMLASVGSRACDEVYLKVGSSYKLDSATVVHTHYGKRQVNDVDKFGARFELGIQQGRWTYGVAHQSQWLSGAPFNNKKEPHRTEIFVDYRFQLWGF